MNNKMKPAVLLPTVNEVLNLIDDCFSFEPEAENIKIFDALGRILATDIEANEFVPSFNRSAMDGYSVFANDIENASKDNPVKLVLKGEVLMGDKADFSLEHNTCIYTPTGAAVPIGTECVVMVEDTKNDNGIISIFKPTEKGKNVTLKGDDVFPGKNVFKKGRKLNISDIGALAAMGITDILVNKKPIVGIISTGDELVQISDVPKDGQIRDVNSTTLALVINQSGAIAKNYGIVKDEEDVLLNVVKEAINECDIVLISGGSSMGEKDATEKIIESLGQLILHGIRMKPGKPTIIGKINNKPVFGVPGHPVSAFFVSRVFVKKIILKMLGQSFDDNQIEAILTTDVKVNKERTVFNFVKLYKDNNTTYATALKTQSGLITSMAQCDGFFAVHHDGNDLHQGDKIIVNLF